MDNIEDLQNEIECLEDEIISLKAEIQMLNDKELVKIKNSSGTDYKSMKAARDEWMNRSSTNGSYYIYPTNINSNDSALLGQEYINIITNTNIVTNTNGTRWGVE